MNYELLTQELLEYYANLLIVQYNGKSKASQTIKLLADMLIAGCLIFQIRDAFDYRTAVVQNAYNFTVVGSPKITEDGIASGFSSSNYIKSTYNLEDGKTYTFIIGGIGGTPRTDRGSYIFSAFFNNGLDGCLRVITSAKTGIVRFALGTGTPDVTTRIAILDGVKYKIELTTDFKSFVTFTDLLTGYTLTKANYSITGQVYGINDITYGVKRSVAPLTAGSIDLKQFSITVDGVEVYKAWQPPAINYRTAVGTQLDIIGKWVGVSRFYNASKYWNSTFLSYPSSNDLVPTDKTDTLQHGYSDYSNFDSETGNILTYDALSSVKQSLSDDNYRIVIGLKIIKNNINHIRGEIDKAIWNYFNHRVYTTWDTHKITYNYPPELADIINVCAYKKVLPVPIGCSISYYQYS